MFPARYFPARMFASRMFPKIGAVLTVVVDAASSVRSLVRRLSARSLPRILSTRSEP